MHMHLHAVWTCASLLGLISGHANWSSDLTLVPGTSQAVLGKPIRDSFNPAPFQVTKSKAGPTAVKCPCLPLCSVQNSLLLPLNIHN